MRFGLKHFQWRFKQFIRYKANSDILMLLQIQRETNLEQRERLDRLMDLNHRLNIENAKLMGELEGGRDAAADTR